MVKYKLFRKEQTHICKFCNFLLMAPQNFYSSPFVHKCWSRNGQILFCGLLEVLDYSCLLSQRYSHRRQAEMIIKKTNDLNTFCHLHLLSLDNMIDDF